MKIVSFMTGANSDGKTGIFLRKLEELVCNYAYLIPNGWRCIAKMQKNGDESPIWRIDVQGNKGGGPYAEAKLHTLETFPELAASGMLTTAMIKDYFKAHGGLPAYAEGLPDNVDKLTDLQREQLRDNAKLTLYHGGIRVPYEALIVNGSNISTEIGEICISFSGASQEQDIFFALAIFRELQQSFITLYPNVQGWCDLQELAKIPAVKIRHEIQKIMEA
jgi:hypothetical protein